MANRLANTIFSTGPRDNLAAVDAYKVQNAGVINSYQETIQRSNPNFSRSLTGRSQTNVTGIIQSLMSLAPGTAQTKNLITAAVSSSPMMQSAIQSADATVRESIQKYTGQSGLNLQGPIMGSNSVMINGRSSNILPAGVIDADGMSKVVNQGIGGNRPTNILDITNPTGQASILSGVINSARSMGVTGIAGDVLSVVSDRRVLGLVTREVMPGFLSSGSARDIVSIIGLVGSGNVLSNFPTLLNSFKRMFGANKLGHYTAPNLVDTYEEIIDMYNKAQPGWNHYTRHTEVGPENCVDISLLIGGTQKFNTILAAGARSSPDANVKPYVVATVLKQESVDNCLRRMYPRSALRLSTTSRSVRDPRMLNIL